MKILAACGPKQFYLVADRIDEGSIHIGDGDVFEVSDEVGRDLLAQFHPKLQPAPEPKKPVKEETPKAADGKAAPKSEAKRATRTAPDDSGPGKQ